MNIKKVLWLLPFVLFQGCGSTTQNDVPKDVLAEIEKLNTVNEQGMSPDRHVQHMQDKSQLNQDLSGFLSQPENISSFPTIEDAKDSVSKDVQSLNTKDESNLEATDLTQLRNQRSDDVKKLRDLIERGKVFQAVRELNDTDEDSLDDNSKQGLLKRKNDAQDQLSGYINRQENQSQNPEVNTRMGSILKDLSDINSQDESVLSPDAKNTLHKKRNDLLDELLGLLDGSIIPKSKEEVDKSTQSQTAEQQPADVDEPSTDVDKPTPPQQNKPDNMVQQPVPISSPTDNKTEQTDKTEPKTPDDSALQEDIQPRKDLFPAILGLNDVQESQLSPDDKKKHNDLKQLLNQELIAFLSKEENQFQNEAVEQKKKDLQDQLIQVNNTDESNLSNEDLLSLRKKRKDLVQELQDLLQNGERTPAAQYNIVSQKQDGISVNKSDQDGSFDVLFTNLLFLFNKTDLKPQVKTILSNIAKLLKDHPEAIAEIGGHSDNIGPAWAKRKIANGRAENAQRFLQNAGIEKARLIARGYSDTKPLARPFTVANRRKNRRVEVHVHMTHDQQQSSDEQSLSSDMDTSSDNESAGVASVASSDQAQNVENTDNSSAVSNENEPPSDTDLQNQENQALSSATTPQSEEDRTQQTKETGMENS